jgi:hypothetical protein
VSLENFLNSLCFGFIFCQIVSSHFYLVRLRGTPEIMGVMHLDSVGKTFKESSYVWNGCNESSLLQDGVSSTGVSFLRCVEALLFSLRVWGWLSPCSSCVFRKSQTYLRTGVRQSHPVVTQLPCGNKKQLPSGGAGLSTCLPEWPDPQVEDPSQLSWPPPDPLVET